MITFERIRLLNKTGVTFFTAKYKGFADLEGNLQVIPPLGSPDDPHTIFTNLATGGDTLHAPNPEVEGVCRLDIFLKPAREAPGGLNPWQVLIPDPMKRIRAVDVELTRDPSGTAFRAVAHIEYVDASIEESPPVIFV